MWTWRRSLKLNRVWGGVSVVREAKSVDLRVHLHLSLESRGCYYHFSGLRFGTVNLFAEETALGST